jgi:hypothetical protein
LYSIQDPETGLIEEIKKKKAQNDFDDTQNDACNKLIKEKISPINKQNYFIL